MDDEDGGLLSIDIDISEDDGETLEKKEARRTGQTEEAFQAVRRDYEIKVENGDIHKSINSPLPSGAKKQDLQEILHAVEELYWMRKYHDARNFARKALETDALDQDSRQLLIAYEEKCQRKVKQ